MPASHKSAGYSLYELLMTMSLAAVILGVGLPSFGGLIADKRLRVETDALFHAVHRARQESIGRRRVVTICPSQDGRFCDPENRWSAGWIVFANRSRTGSSRRELNETLIQHHQVGDDVEIMSNRKSLSFRSTHLRATNGTLVVCDATGRAIPRALVVSYTGRPRVARKDTRGRDYQCAR